jgi:hypothetical protein
MNKLLTSIGFTGTQKGMTDAQKRTVGMVLSGMFASLQEAHHGMCIGADHDFHDIVRHIIKESDKQVKIVGHPPKNKSKFVKDDVDVLMEDKEYLDRNHDIVDSADMLIATPDGDTEKLRSGTWATIRYAKKQGKKVIIVKPLGQMSFYNN